jgi:hypothetical protein
MIDVDVEGRRNVMGPKMNSQFNTIVYESVQSWTEMQSTVRDVVFFAKGGNQFADERRSLDRYSSLVDSDQGVFFLHDQELEK